MYRVVKRIKFLKQLHVMHDNAESDAQHIAELEMKIFLFFNCS